MINGQISVLNDPINFLLQTWREKIHNNMARYWLEHIGSTDIVAWQYIRNFDIDIWSTILYSLPTPGAHL